MLDPKIHWHWFWLSDCKLISSRFSITEYLHLCINKSPFIRKIRYEKISACPSTFIYTATNVIWYEEEIPHLKIRSDDFKYSLSLCRNDKYPEKSYPSMSYVDFYYNISISFSFFRKESLIQNWYQINESIWHIGKYWIIYYRA